MAKSKTTKEGKASFKEGCFIRPFGPNTCIDNSNVTDAIAAYWLDKHPEDAELFETLPTKN